jgi:hypothetical protein
MDFQTKARRHQEKYRTEILKLSSYDVYPSMLTDEDANFGHNFCSCVPGVLESVKERYGDFKGPLFKNLLRSEHIPFNLFAPFQKCTNDLLVFSFIQRLFPNIKIEKVISVDIEKTPETRQYLSTSSNGKKEKYLDDKTSFDVLLIYESGGRVGGVGIEVKYTEKSYPYGTTERERMFCTTADSLYHRTHETSQIYREATIPLLREKKLKQLWRNHLVGLSMVQNGDLAEFTSCHMFPSGNVYQAEAACEYLETIKKEHQHTFLPLTYESFIDVALRTLSENEKWKPWIEYIERRYIC